MVDWVWGVGGGTEPAAGYLILRRRSPEGNEKPRPRQLRMKGSLHEPAAEEPVSISWKNWYRFLGMVDSLLASHIT